MPMASLFYRVKDACTGLVHFLLDVSMAEREIPMGVDDDDDDAGTEGHLYRSREVPRNLSPPPDGFSEDITLRRGMPPLYKEEHQKGKQVAVEVPQLTLRVGDKQLQDEIEKTAWLNHPNIGNFPGFCTEIDQTTTECKRRIVIDTIHRALCFEYLPKGNLDKYLIGEDERLDWHTCYKIIIGICEGLRYIHEELEVPMYHLHLKPNNILIDEKMVIKVINSGVSRIYDEQRIWCIMSRLGGEHLLPGYTSHQVLSKEFDIFSLGVLIMKIMGIPMAGDIQPTEIVELVHNRWRKRLRSTPGCKPLEANFQQVKSCIKIAIQCLEENIYERPNIGDIIRELNKASINFQESLVGEEINDDIYEYISEYPGLVAPRLKLDFLKKITNDFSSKQILGEGGYATVYKGEDEDGRVIAVKKIFITSKVDSKQFENEARHLSTLAHQNIVKLEGYCYEEEMHVFQHEGRGIKAAKIYMLLCFEYMSSGSLENHLSDATSGLNWSQRYKIIEGICNGLHYLHEGKEGSPIIHRDLKPGNILLDGNMTPKIADFGISRLIGEDKTHTRTLAIVGTWPYLSPEFKQNGVISKKLDIFSLGLIITEIISGKKIYRDNIGTPNEEFIELLEKWRSRLQKEGSMEENYAQLYACIILSMECMDIDPQKRPTTEQIIHTLNKTKECQFRSGESFHLPNTSALPSLETYDGDNIQYNSETELEGASPLPIELSLQFLKDITKNFSSELEISQGVSGVVYQGVHPSGGIIAVKRLRKTIRGGERQFHNTVGDLLALEHKNVAKLIGCCYEVEREAAACNRGSLHAYKQDNFLCYEYLHGESLDKCIYEKSCKLSWDTRLRIIKEICEGLHFLHVESGRDIIHLNLKPSSIILDDKMVPKIANSGLQRLFGQENTPPAQDVSGRLAYMAPEYLYCGEEKLESDIYSLGLLIMEVVTGNKSCFSEGVLLPWHFIGNVRKDWTNTSYIKSEYPSLDTDGHNQVKCCIMIGLKCADIRPKERPRIGEVLSELDKICPVPTELLGVYPLQLHFPFKRNGLNCCSPQLTNMTDDRYAVRLLSDNQKKCMARGVVPPRSTYTLVVSMRKPPNSGEFFTLESSIVGEGGLNLKDVHLDSTNKEFHDFFKEAQASSTKKVHQRKLEVVCGAQDELIQPGIEIISKTNFPQVLSVDVHQTEPWIMTSHHGGQIFIWDYHTQAIVMSVELSEESVYSTKFIEREQWFVSGDDDGDIYVYSYDKQHQVTSFRGHHSRIESLAVHPIRPFILSSSAHIIELWNWENNWECTQTFKEHSDKVTQITFNPVDTNSFASASLDHTIKIWNVSSPNSTITLSADGLQSLRYIIKDIGQFLISDSQDGTTKTFKGHANHLGSLYRHSDLTVLVSGSLDGTVRLLNPITYRTEKIIGLNLGAVYAFGYLTDSRRIIVGCHRGIAVIEPNLL